ncbi:MAG: DMT family transporter [Pseudomonadota bacterium]
MIASCSLIAATTLIAKVLGLRGGAYELHPLQISAGRFCFAWMAIALFVMIRRPSFAGTAWGTHCARSFLGWLGVTAMFAASASLPLASATALSFLSPVVTMVCAILFLGERVGIWRWSAAAVSLAGAMLLTKPGAETLQIAALIALAAALFMGVEAILIKRLSDNEPPLRILFINNSIGAVVSLTAAAFVWDWPSDAAWILLALLGVTMASAQALFIQAMKHSEASAVMPLFYSILVFAALYDYLLFEVVPDLATAAGAVLIAIGAIAISIRSAGNRSGRST